MWNWKIPYLTFFVSENKLKINKIEYIISNLNDSHFLIIYPIISTIILLTIIPFLSNGAYWLSIKFESWKSRHKNLIESKQLLTIEQSIELREQISKQEERFSKLVQDKNSEIISLKKQIESEKTAENEVFINDDPELELKRLADRINNNKEELNSFNKITSAIQNDFRLQEDSITTKIIALLEAYNIIHKPDKHYRFTDIGKRFIKYIMTE